MQQVNYYTSLNVEGPSEDAALHLCRDCARKHRDDVQWLGAGHDQAECEFCGASNDEAYSRQLDATYAEVTGSPAPARPGARR